MYKHGVTNLDSAMEHMDKSETNHIKRNCNYPSMLMEILRTNLHMLLDTRGEKV